MSVSKLISFFQQRTESVSQIEKRAPQIQRKNIGRLSLKREQTSEERKVRIIDSDSESSVEKIKKGYAKVLPVLKQKSFPIKEELFEAKKVQVLDPVAESPIETIETGSSSLTGSVKKAKIGYDKPLPALPKKRTVSNEKAPDLAALLSNSLQSRRAIVSDDEEEQTKVIQRPVRRVRSLNGSKIKDFEAIFKQRSVSLPPSRPQSPPASPPPLPSPTNKTPEAKSPTDSIPSAPPPSIDVPLAAPASSSSTHSTSSSSPLQEQIHSAMGTLRKTITPTEKKEEKNEMFTQLAGTIRAAGIVFEEFADDDGEDWS